MNIEQNLEIGFNLLCILNFEDPSILRIEQSYYSTPLTNPQLKISNNQISVKYFSSVTLLGLKYKLIIDKIKTQDILIFATPVEHLLGINILFLENSKVFRIEYELKTYLIHESQIEYLQKPYTILEEIKANLFSEFSYITPFSKEISFLLPRNKHKQKTIQIVEKKFFDKLLFTPHINSLHLNYAIQKHIFLYNIYSDKKILSLIHKHIHYLTHFSNSHFEDAQIIEVIHTKYPIEVIEQEKDILFHHISTQYYYKLTPNLELEIITSNKEEFSIPSYLNSSLNIFYPFKDSEEFLLKSGVCYSYKPKKLQELIIKDENFSILTLTPMFISFQLKKHIKKIHAPLCYSKPQEYHIITKIIQKNYLINSNTFLNIDSLNKDNLVIKKIPTLNEEEISTLNLKKHRPKFYKDCKIDVIFNKIESSFLILNKFITQTQNSIISLTTLPQNIIPNFQNNHNSILKGEYNSIKAQTQILKQKLKLLNNLLTSEANLNNTFSNQKFSHLEFQENLLFNFKFLLQEIEQILLQISNQIIFFQECVSKCNNYKNLELKLHKEEIYYSTLIIKEIELTFKIITKINIQTELLSNQDIQKWVEKIQETIETQLDITFFKELEIYTNLKPENNEKYETLEEVKTLKKLTTTLNLLKTYLNQNNCKLHLKSSLSKKYEFYIKQFLERRNINLNIIFELKDLNSFSIKLLSQKDFELYISN
ncbi:MAG: hypothetical protein ACMXYB_00475 [Candidatus Woesearchaeota archaeon]